MYLLAPFIVQNLKKNLGQIQSYKDTSFLRPKWTICPVQNDSFSPNKIFFSEK